MSISLDLRRPLFVFLGAWNRAIFSPNWIALHLFGYPEGEEVAAREVVETVEAKKMSVQKKAIYFESVGIVATNSRIEIFVNDLEPQTIEKAEHAALSMIQTLPHTPLGPFGVNFAFFERDADIDLLDLLTANDKVDSHYEVVSQEFTTGIRIDDNVVCNLRRSVTGSDVTFDFNFHHQEFSRDQAAEWISASTDKFLGQSRKILETLYGLSGDDVVKHEFSAGVKSENQ